MIEKSASDSELKVLHILLESERELTVRELMEILECSGIRWANRTISTFLGRLEEKGFVDHRKRGITNYYFPSEEGKSFRNNEVKRVVKRYFHGSIKQFLAAFVDGEEISDEEIQEIREWVKEFDD